MLDAILIMGTAVVPVSIKITACNVNVLVLNLELEYQTHLLQMEFATMKQIPLTVGLMDLIVVDQISLRITALNVLVILLLLLYRLYFAV